MRPVTRTESGEPADTTTLLTIALIEATAQVTAAMVHVTAEKNPAKVSEAYRSIYKTIVETVKSTPIK